MPRFFKYIMLLLATIYGGGTALYAQEIKLGADFVTLFDNKEYATLKNETSGTLFSARLTPKVGVEWSEGRNELTFAVDMVQDFGHASKFLSDINVQLYYAYKAPRVKLYAGIFPRCAMRGLSSPLFFDRAYTYYNNRIGGVLARYEDPNYGDSYVEFAMDYTGMRDFDTREAFMIMTSGRMPIKSIYIGYDLLVGHYAKEKTETLRSFDDKKRARLYKSANFDYVTFCGEFDIRSNNSVKSVSGLLCIDFDHVAELEVLFSKLLKDDYFNTVLLFRSPSGDGLKWVIEIPPSDLPHPDFFRAIENYIFKVYGIKIDGSGKDISRACFLCHDPNAYINPNYI